MKIFPLIIAFIAFYWTAGAQHLQSEARYCTALKDSIRYRVWLPEDYNATRKYPVIYTMEDTEDGLVAGAAGLYAHAGLIPEAIVVGVEKGRSWISFDFKSGSPDEKGVAFLAFLTDVIMPGIEKDWHTSIFRVFMGHSLSSTYANYLFLHRPGIFSAYMVFAPERWWIDETRPVFELDDSALRYYNGHPCFYYLASGSLDEPRRKAYAREIEAKVSILDSNRFAFHFDSKTGSDHISIVCDAINAALAQVFQPYYRFNTSDSVTDPLAFFINTRQQLKE